MGRTINGDYGSGLPVLARIVTPLAPLPRQTYAASYSGCSVARRGSADGQKPRVRHRGNRRRPLRAAMVRLISE